MISETYHNLSIGLSAMALYHTGSLRFLTNIAQIAVVPSYVSRVIRTHQRLPVPCTHI